MAILIANLGVSDLTFRVDEYFLAADSAKPSNNQSTGSSKHEFWDNRNSYVKTFIADELGLEGLNSKFFRELTKRLSELYLEDQEKWHPRIRPGRIQGVFETVVKKFEVTKAYLFVTDQVSPALPNGHDSDTVFLFTILQKYFQQEMPQLLLVKKVIPQEISATDQDKLLNFYYEFFASINPEEQVLASIKGGTQPMQTAMQVQAMTCGIRRLLFVEPEFSIDQIMDGLPSECRFTAYWKFARNQKWNTVKQLLERWDFDGVQKIIHEWEQELKWLTEQGVLLDFNSNELLLQVLSCILACSNLDRKSAKNIIGNYSSLRTNESFKKILHGNFDEILHLYSQCKIKLETSQIPDFLWRMSSFYEGILNDLIVEWFKKLKIPNAILKKSNGYFLVLKNAPKEYLVHFRNLEKVSENTDEHKLESRDSKKHAVEALVKFDAETGRNSLMLVSAEWVKLSELLTSLDYWAKQRNQIVHNAQGVTLESMMETLSSDRENVSHRNSFEKIEIEKACPPNEILSVMAEIYKLYAKIFKKPELKTFGNGEGYYLYADVREWIIQLLNISNSD